MSIFIPLNYIYVTSSSVAQWQSNRLLTDRSLVRIQPGEQLIMIKRLYFYSVAVFIFSRCCFPQFVNSMISGTSV